MSNAEQNAALGAVVRALPSGFSIGRDRNAETYFLEWSRLGCMTHGVCGRLSPEDAIADFIEVYRGYLEFLSEEQANALKPAIEALEKARAAHA